MLVAQLNNRVDKMESFPQATHRPSTPRQGRQRPSKKTNPSRKLKIAVFITMLLVIGLFGIIGALTVHITVVKGAEIKALEKELQTLSTEKDLLQVEADQLRSVARIEKVALAMGMEKPEGTIYVDRSMLASEKTLGVETQATAAAPIEGKANSLYKNVFQIFTSFFATTQR